MEINSADKSNIEAITDFVLNESNIDKVISIVNRICYHGNNNSTTETINLDMKTKLKGSFIDFLGVQHKDKISERIDDMNIYRLFHIVGSRNSISQFLFDERAKVFNANREQKITEPENLEYFATTPIEKILEDAASNSKVQERLENLCDCIGIKVNALNKHRGQAKFQEVVNELYQSYMNTPFSENPEQNEQMGFLAEYCNAYMAYIQNKYEKLNMSIESYFDNPYEICRWDPIYNKLALEDYDLRLRDAEYLFTTESSVEAYCIGNNIFLGINPHGGVIIHEVLHSVVFNNKTSKTGFQYGENLRYFDEVIVEYFSQIIREIYIALWGEDLTINDKPVLTSYETALFKYMKPFMKAFSPEIKEVLLGDNPVQEMLKIIGKKDFKTIVYCCDTIFRIGHDSNSKEALHQIERLGGRIKTTTWDAKLKKPPIERLINVISRNAKKIANRIKILKLPSLSKLVDAICVMTDYLDQHTQGKVRENLDKKGEEDLIYFEFEEDEILEEIIEEDEILEEIIEEDEILEEIIEEDDMDETDLETEGVTPETVQPKKSNRKKKPALSYRHNKTSLETTEDNMTMEV